MVIVVKKMYASLNLTIKQELQELVTKKLLKPLLKKDEKNISKRVRAETIHLSL